MAIGKDENFRRASHGRSDSDYGLSHTVIVRQAFEAWISTMREKNLVLSIKSGFSPFHNVDDKGSLLNFVGAIFAEAQFFVIPRCGPASKFNVAGSRIPGSADAPAQRPL